VDALSVRNWNPAVRTGHAQFFGAFGLFVAATVNMPHMLAEVSDRAAAARVSYLELMATLDRDASGRLAGSLAAPAEGVLTEAWQQAVAGAPTAVDGALTALRDALLRGGLRDSAAVALRRLDEVEGRQRELQRCGADRPAGGCDVEIRYLYQVQRARAPELVFAQILMGFEMAALDARVVGLNLVQPEDHYVAVRDYSLHMRMIGMLRPLYPGVKVSLHAGELAPGLVPPERMRYHITEAVRVARADRIGHGVAIAHEDDAHALLQEMAERRVLVEIALSSNDVILGIRGRRHPLRLYLDYGVPVTLATDDEGVLRSDLSLEYHRAIEEHALRYAELKEMARNSILHAFADAATQERLLRRLDRDFEEFERTWSQRAP
jgi:adenosine deaminase